MTLREAIEKAISLGEHDPHRIAETVAKRYDKKWLAAELLGLADEIVPDLARRMLTSQRRSSLSLATIGTVERGDLMLRAAWLPGVGWVEFGKFTADDFDRLAATYRKGARALDRYADWCESAAAAMRAAKAGEFRELTEIPELPPAEEAA